MLNKILVSVIIPTYKREQVLVDTIKSVLNQKFSRFELIVVDQTLIHDLKVKEFLISNKKIRYFKISPPSLPAARNFGLTKAKAKFVIFIDDDVYLDKDFIKAHFESYLKYDVVSVVGRIKEKGKKPGRTLMYFRKTGFGAGSFDYPNISFAETVQGCNMSFRKNILLKVGGFDTNYIGNALREESDISYKLKSLGYKILFNPDASLLHLLYPTGGCREEKPRADNYIQYRNESLFFLRHRPKIHLVYFLGGRLYRYVFDKETVKQGKVLLRLYILIKGLLAGTLIYLKPKAQIISKEVN